MDFRQAGPAKSDIFRRGGVAISHLSNGCSKAGWWPNIKGGDWEGFLGLLVQITSMPLDDSYCTG